MPEQKKRFRISFIPNLVGGTESLDKLYNCLNKAAETPSLINVFIENEAYGFEGQSNLGGFGKSLIIEEASLYLDEEPAKISKIDLAVRYTTKKDILWQVGKKLCLPQTLSEWLGKEGMEEWTEIERERFKTFYDDIFVRTNDKNFSDYDPSFIAEKLFAKVTACKPISVPWGAKILFFDSFDHQYLGDNHATLRIWLRDSLFPYLVLKLGITVFVSGREELEHENRLLKNELPIQTFKLQAFDQEQCRHYFADFGKRKENHEHVKSEAAKSRNSNGSPNEHTFASQAKTKWQELTNNLSDATWAEIRSLTNGKPIMLDFFADLVYRKCIVFKESDSVEEVIRTAKSEGKPENGNDDRGRFEMYIVNRLHNHSLNKTEIDGQGYDMADALIQLSIARHGMEVKDFVQVRDRLKKESDIPKATLKATTDFFNHTFHKDYLSFVKNIKDEAPESNTGNGLPQDRRVLHDEVIALFRQYYFEVFDPQHEKRNSYLEQITAMYKDQMQEITRDHDRYPRLLLEYMEYRFDIVNLEKERATINFYLYEFSRYLNRYHDLNTRFIQIARAYYRKKEDLYRREKERLELDSVHFSQHFNLLSKILLRENHFYLTTREKGWNKKIYSNSRALLEGTPQSQMDLNSNRPIDEPLPIINDIYNIENLDLIDERDQIGLRARGLSATGEAKIWQANWEEARIELEKSKELFYRTGESHGLGWVEHLLGFESQRGARFVQAEKHHLDALDTAFLVSQRLLVEAQFEKKENPDDWHHRYRLRYLAELSNRANGNLAVQQRYQGRLLDALKTLNSNRLLAKISGTREEVRNNTNRVQYSAIVGRDNDYQPLIQSFNNLSPGLSDTLLRRRVPNTELVYLTKTIGLESRLYRKRFQNYREIKDRNREKIEKHIPVIEIACLNLAIALVPESNPLEQGKKINPWLSLLPLNEEQNPLYGESTNREIGDMYYQFGKLVLTAQFVPEGLQSTIFYKRLKEKYVKNGEENLYFFEVAKVAFQNAYEAAKKSTFLYLQMESAESLYRLCYLSPKHKTQSVEARGLYLAAQTAMESEPTEYGVFHDLLSRFYICEADIEIDHLLIQKHLIPELFRTTLSHLAEALWHGYCHNQERYMLMLNVFTNRMRSILMHLQESGLEEEFAEYFLEDILSKSRIYKEDPNFHFYLGHFLRALKMEMEEEISWKKYRKIKLGIAGLMERGKFVKASDVSASLIRLLKRALERPRQKEVKAARVKRQLALCYFQRIYCFLGANRWRRAVDLLEDAREVFNKEDPFVFGSESKKIITGGYQFGTVEAAIVGIAKGSACYRTNEYWNIETFIRGELLGKFLQGSSYPQRFMEAECYLLGAAYKIWDELNKDAASILEARNRHLVRLMSESLFRLGELYILLETRKNEKPKVEEWAKKELVPKIDGMLKTLKTNKSRFKLSFAKGCKYDDFLSILLLNCAYYLARFVDDRHRAADSLQSIANARYALGETRENKSADTGINESGRKNVVENIHKGIIQYTRESIVGSDKKRVKYPIVEAKMWLVEGDVYFSELFIKKPDADAFDFRHENFPEGDLRRNSKIKGTLHEMMWRYLTALDLLTSDTNMYDSYHFQNMAFEINRRIMYISDPKWVHYVMEDLKSAWNLFPNLKLKDRILKSLEHDLRTHALALAIQNILNPSHTSAP